MLWSDSQAGLDIYSIMVHIMKTLTLPPWLISEKVTQDCKLGRAASCFSKVHGSIAREFPFAAFR